MIIYTAALFACCFYAAARGGTPERLGALILFLGSFLTVAVAPPVATRFSGVEYGILIVDVAVLLAYFSLALYSDRYWPLWTAALQLIGVLAHLARIADPEMLPNGYGFLHAFWGYPMLLTIAVGTWSHHKRKSLRAADHS